MKPNSKLASFVIIFLNSHENEIIRLKILKICFLAPLIVVKLIKLFKRKKHPEKIRPLKTMLNCELIASFLNALMIDCVSKYHTVPYRITTL